MAWRRERLPTVLLGAYLLVWIGLGIDPLDRRDWVLENLLVFLTVPALVLMRRRLGFSDASYILLFFFYVLHAIGGHWSYSNVPIDWEAMGFERNHYDRLVHLSFGLLLWLPAREAIGRLFGLRFFPASLFAATTLMSASGIYEVLEWLTVEIVAPDLGNAFLGAQGDEFDAPKDMGLAACGLIVSSGTALIVHALKPGTANQAPVSKTAPPGTAPKRSGSAAGHAAPVRPAGNLGDARSPPRRHP